MPAAQAPGPARFLTRAVPFAALTASAFIAMAAAPSPAAKPAPNTTQIAENYGKLPLSFEANQGQSNPQVKFLSRGNGYSLFLTNRAAVLSLSKAQTPHACHPERSEGSVSPAPLATQTNPCPAQSDTIEMQLSDANPAARVEGANQLPGTANYFIGDEKNWHTNVPTYAKVKYSNVYNGIDLVYYGNQRQLEYDFVVSPGASAKPIQLHFAGAQKLKRDPNGDLEVIAKNGRIAFHKPVLYQEKDGQRQPIEGSFKLLANYKVTFVIGQYDPSRALVIDPVLAYSTYLGGAGVPNGPDGPFGSDGGQGEAIAVDASGNAYVAGLTSVIDFPTTSGAFQTASDAGKLTTNTAYSFVSKLNATGSALIYSTYLGGSGGPNNYPNVTGDTVASIAVDSEGNAYLAGATHSLDFPITEGAFQTTNTPAPFGGTSGFVAKLNPTGTALLYSTFLSGSGRTEEGGPTAGDQCAQVKVNSAGYAYVTGSATSYDFPTTKGALTPTINSRGGNTAAFVTELNASGSELVYSTYLGGSLIETGNSVALDSKGDAFVVGQTRSTDFPVTADAYQNINKAELASGQATGFVAKLNPTGSALVYATYLGGSVKDDPTGIAIDAAGDAYVSGLTASPDFPLLNPIQTTNKTYANPFSPNTYLNAFIAKLNTAGSALVYSTYLGSEQGETGNTAIAIDASENAYVTGTTWGVDFPVTPNAFQSENNSLQTYQGTPYGATTNAFVAEISSVGKLEYSTYFGGGGFNYYAQVGLNPPGYAGDSAAALALDAAGNVYLTGTAQSFDFPTTSGAYSTGKTAETNAFLSKFTMGAASSTTSLTSLQAGVNPQTLASNVNFTAFVRSASGAGIPTGSVVFSYPGGSKEVTLDNTGHAAFPTAQLAEGANTIVATYSGDKGLTASSDKMTEIIDHGPSTIAVVAGSAQTTIVNTPLPNRVVFIVKDASGKPVPETEVVFSGNNLTFIPAYLAYTDFNGEAEVAVIPNSTGSLTGVAKGNGVVSPAYFTLTANTQTSAPVISPAAGSYASAQSITITDATAGATIFYTLNGTTPTTASTKYTKAIEINQTTTVNAIAIAGGDVASTVTSAAFIIELPVSATPVIKPAAGSYSEGQLVAITDATPGSTIFYTTNGVAPTTSSTKYAAPFLVGSNQTIGAIATATNYTQSNIASGTYTFIGSPSALALPATAIATPDAILNAIVNTLGLAGSYYFQYGTSSTALTTTTAKTALSAVATPVAASAKLTTLKTRSSSPPPEAPVPAAS